MALFPGRCPPYAIPLSVVADNGLIRLPMSLALADGREALTAPDIKNLAGPARADS